MKHEIKIYKKFSVCQTPIGAGEASEVRQCSCGRTWLYTKYYRGPWRWHDMSNNKRWLRFFKKEKDAHYEIG